MAPTSCVSKCAYSHESGRPLVYASSRIQLHLCSAARRFRKSTSVLVVNNARSNSFLLGSSTIEASQARSPRIQKELSSFAPKLRADCNAYSLDRRSRAAFLIGADCIKLSCSRVALFLAMIGTQPSDTARYLLFDHSAGQKACRGGAAVFSLPVLPFVGTSRSSRLWPSEAPAPWRAP